MNRNLSRQILFLPLLGCIFTFSQAGIIRGKVMDSRSGDPLIGASVIIKNTKYSAIVNLDGSFIIRNVPTGNYEIFAKDLGYLQSDLIKVKVSGVGKESKIIIRLMPAINLLQQVQITRHFNPTTDEGVVSLEKNGIGIQNILSQNTIRLLPDVTVANVLQRISGITVQRNKAGEGRYAIIRGMAQRYNNTLVNGVEIPSPDDKYRFIPMDIFPSGMLERLVVTKSLTPNMEGDAIGGTMNLIMKSAPDQFLFKVNVSGGYSTLFSNRSFSAFNHSVINKKSPAEINGNNYAATAKDFPLGNLHYSNLSIPVNSMIGFTIGSRTRNKRLGAILAVNYQNFYRGSNSEYLVPSAQPGDVPVANTPVFTDAYDRQYSVQTNRLGIQNKIDYIINDHNEISLFNLYVHENEFQTRYTIDTIVGTNSSATSKDVDVEHRSRWQIQDIYNATLHGVHQLGNRFKLDWDAVYSIARNQVPDMAWYDFNANVLLNPNGMIQQVDSTTYGTSMSRVWQHNTDQDWDGYLNLTYDANIINRNVEFEGGGLIRFKTRKNYYNSYNLTPTYTTAQPYTAIDSIPFAFSPATNGTGNITALNANFYTAHEKITSGYIQAKFLLVRSLQVLGGVRIENTQQEYNTVMPVSFNGRSGTIHYTDVLPSIHFKYLINDIQDLRLSYFKSISRPGFGEIDPYIVPGEVFTEIGNPYLKHVRADNLDLRYGLFPGAADELLLGVFYKLLRNPIEYFVTTNGGPTAEFIQPENVNKATNYGFEAVFTRYFGMFGFSINYTYTHSQVTTKKLLYYYAPGIGSQTDSTSETRPLQGQADNVGNISLLYKNPKIGLDMQLAFAYTGDRIAQVSQYYNLDIWQKPYSQLDFSLEKRLTRHFYFSLKINNLNNAPNELYMKTAPSVVNKQFSGNYKLPFQGNDINSTIVQKDIYKLSFLGGIRYKF
ncbi:MAG TPA: TonB-dependent receptor [Chitinophagaceae bacterium]|nr:TonB-dependent receptor [Chitinophagaceae bacterium]